MSDSQSPVAPPNPQSPVEIRRLWRSDIPAFRDHLVGLDSTSRHWRFGAGMSDEFLSHYAESCFGKGDLVFGAFIDGHLAGAAELRSSEAIWTEQAPFNRHVHAEAAFSVGDAYRRRGIGEMLFRRLESAASNHGVETIEIVCMPGNVGMIKLAQKFKAKFTFEENQLTGRLTARRPTAFSLFAEATKDMADYTSSLFDLHLRALARPEAGATAKAGTDHREADRAP